MGNSCHRDDPNRVAHRCKKQYNDDFIQKRPCLFDFVSPCRHGQRGDRSGHAARQRADAPDLRLGDLSGQITDGSFQKRKGSRPRRTRPAEDHPGTRRAESVCLHPVRRRSRGVVDRGALHLPEGVAICPEFALPVAQRSGNIHPDAEFIIPQHSLLPHRAAIRTGDCRENCFIKMGWSRLAWNGCCCIMFIHLPCCL